MSGSDNESYEVIDGRYSPPVRHHVSDKRRAMTHAGFTDTRKSSSCSPIPQDIDFRPPYPTPKSQAVRSPAIQTGSSYLTYDRITLSPVVPDYEVTSTSPPRQNGFHHSPSPLSDTPPPLPPFRRPPTRSSSDSTDHHSQTPPRSFTQNNQNGHYSVPTSNRASNSHHVRSNSSSQDTEGSGSGTVNPSYSRQSSTKARSSSMDSFQPAIHPDTYVRDSIEMSLSVFTENHKKDLPVQVVVTKGFYGADERTSISEGDMFNIHFFKQTKVVKISDTNKYSYTIPLNSSLEFGLIYDLPPGFKQPDSKYHFKTVGEILQLKTLPKVVRAMKAFKGNGPESSVEQYDLLLLKEVKQKRGLKTSRVLKCIHAGSGVKKTLSEDCAGCFSVRSQDVRLFLPEIVEHIDLPQLAILYYGGGARLDLPPHLISSEVKIQTMEIEESMVATSILEEDEQHMMRHYENTPSIPLVDIPTDLDIEVAVIKLAEQDTDQLYSETRQLLEKFNPSQVSYLNLKNSVTANAQSTFFKAIRQDQNRQIGIEILRPENAFRTASSQTSLNRLSNGSDSSRRQLCTPAECANAEEVNSRLESLESNTHTVEGRLNMFELKMQSLEKDRPDHDGLKKDLMALKTEMYKIKRDCDDVRKAVTDMKDSVSKLSSKTEKLVRSVDSLQAEIKEHQLDLKENERPSNTYIQMFPAGESKSSAHLKSGSLSSAEKESQNKKSLATLDCTQVCQLLAAMGLGSYESNFTKEQITGEILAELNDETLKDELGMSSKIHRIKLMKIVTGRHSAMSVLNGEDPYYVHLGQQS